MRFSTSTTSKEKLRVTVSSDVDPTGAVVEVGKSTSAAAPTTWYAGSWSGSYSGRRATFLTPTIGPAGTITTTVGDVFDLWVRITTADEIIALPFERVEVT